MVFLFFQMQLKSIGHASINDALIPKTYFGYSSQVFTYPKPDTGNLEVKVAKILRRIGLFVAALYFTFGDGIANSCPWIELENWFS